MLKLKARNIRTQHGETRRWYITGTCPYTKRRVRESTGTDSRDEAQNVLAAYLTRARDEATQGPANGTALFAEAVVEYLGKKGEARFLDPLLVEFGKLRLRDITDQKPLRSLATRFIRARRHRPLFDNFTVRCRLSGTPL